MLMQSLYIIKNFFYPYSLIFLLFNCLIITITTLFNTGDVISLRLYHVRTLNQESDILRYTSAISAHIDLRLTSFLLSFDYSNNHFLQPGSSLDQFYW